MPAHKIQRLLRKTDCTDQELRCKLIQGLLGLDYECRFPEKCHLVSIFFVKVCLFRFITDLTAHISSDVIGPSRFGDAKACFGLTKRDFLASQKCNSEKEIGAFEQREAAYACLVAVKWASALQSNQKEHRKLFS